MAKCIREDIYLISVPLPNNPLKQTNTYLIKGERNLLIDTGFNHKICREFLKKELSEIGANMDETDIFITHMHSDHSGNIAGMRGDSSKIFVSRLDGHYINLSRQEDYWQELSNIAREYGPFHILEGYNIEQHPGKKYCNEEEIVFDFLSQGDYLSVGKYKFKCIWTPGHTPGHLCLYEEKEKILFSGDHVLTNITPNICIEVGVRNPLKTFLNSLDKIYNLEVKEVLPAHRHSPKSMKARIEEIKEHHKLRAEEALKIIGKQEMDAYSVAKQMTWSVKFSGWDDFPLPQKWFAFGETIAHLEYLFEENQLNKRKLQGYYVFSKK